MKKEKIGCYRRISKGDDIDQSLAVQQVILNKYAKDNNIKFVESYVDTHKQTVEDRPGFNRLMKDILLGKIDTLVVVGGADRLTRNTEILERISYEVKIKFIFPKVNYELL